MVYSHPRGNSHGCPRGCRLSVVTDSVLISRYTTGVTVSTRERFTGAGLRARWGIAPASLVAALTVTAIVVVAGATHASADVTPSPTPSSSSTPAPTPTPTPTPTVAPSPTYAPGMAPNEHAGWAIVNPTTGQVTGGVIVCTPEVCGSGWFAGMRVVLQTLQDPVEAARAANGVGNVAGYSGGTYNFATGQWTMPGSSGSTLQIPLAYPGADQGGTVHVPTCVANCPTPTPSPSGSGSPSDEPSASPSPSASSSADPNGSSGPVTTTSSRNGYTVTLAAATSKTASTVITATRNGHVIKRWTIPAGGSGQVALLLPSNYKGAKITVTRAGKRVAFTALT